MLIVSWVILKKSDDRTDNLTVVQQRVSINTKESIIPCTMYTCT